VESCRSKKRKLAPGENDDRRSVSISVGARNFAVRRDNWRRGKTMIVGQFRFLLVQEISLHSSIGEY
jgi:hypothetical protein